VFEISEKHSKFRNKTSSSWGRHSVLELQLFYLVLN